MNGTLCYIGIGSNLGEPLANCKTAIEKLAGVKGVLQTAVSSFYRTEPVGFEEQEFFINAVVEIKTTLGPHQLLGVLQKIENEMGRKRTFKNAPRIIDLDILFYGQKVIQDENLVIPHPEAHRRGFVLEPMNEIASYFIHPSFGVSIRGLKERLTGNKKVEKVRE